MSVNEEIPALNMLKQQILKNIYRDVGGLDFDLCWSKVQESYGAVLLSPEESAEIRGASDINNNIDPRLQFSVLDAWPFLDEIGFTFIDRLMLALGLVIEAYDEVKEFLECLTFNYTKPQIIRAATGCTQAEAAFLDKEYAFIFKAGFLRYFDQKGSFFTYEVDEAAKKILTQVEHSVLPVPMELAKIVRDYQYNHWIKPQAREQDKDLSGILSAIKLQPRDINLWVMGERMIGKTAELARELKAANLTAYVVEINGRFRNRKSAWDLIESLHCLDTILQPKKNVVIWIQGAHYLLEACRDGDEGGAERLREALSIIGIPLVFESVPIEIPSVLTQYLNLLHIIRPFKRSELKQHIIDFGLDAEQVEIDELFLRVAGTPGVLSRLVETAKLLSGEESAESILSRLVSNHAQGQKIF